MVREISDGEVIMCVRIRRYDGEKRGKWEKAIELMLPG